MNYQDVLENAKKSLPKSYSIIVKDIEDRIASGSTGGEIASNVGRYLIELKSINPDAYNILKEVINSFIKNCQRNGLIF